MTLEFLDESTNSHDRLWDKLCPIVGTIFVLVGLVFAIVCWHTANNHAVGNGQFFSNGIIAMIGIGFGTICIIATIFSKK